MRKAVAMLLAVFMVLAFSVTALAQTKGLLEWNEETQQWEITLYDDGEPDDWWVNPDPHYEEVPLMPADSIFLPDFD